MMINMNRPTPSDVQKRIARITVGSSTVRGQPKGTVTAAIAYLEQMNLANFCNINQIQFEKVLNTHTDAMQNQLPAKSWGIARKVLNIFLMEISLNRLLCVKFDLDKLENWLEVPLDNPNAFRLLKQAKQEGINLRWHNIRDLEKKDSDALQAYAQTFAEKQGCSRGYLDVLWWRGN